VSPLWVTAEVGAFHRSRYVDSGSTRMTSPFISLPCRRCRLDGQPNIATPFSYARSSLRIQLKMANAGRGDPTFRGHLQKTCNRRQPPVFYICGDYLRFIKFAKGWSRRYAYLCHRCYRFCWLCQISKPQQMPKLRRRCTGSVSMHVRSGRERHHSEEAMKMQSKLNKVALVTGANKGIGFPCRSRKKRSVGFPCGSGS